MTITMNLEIELGIFFEEISSVLSVMGAEHTIESGYLKGNFKYSGVYFYFVALVLLRTLLLKGLMLIGKQV